MKHLPLVLGFVVGLIVLGIAGDTGLTCFIVGVFFGGWVPLYFMPWLRRRLS